MAFEGARTGGDWRFRRIGAACARLGVQAGWSVCIGYRSNERLAVRSYLNGDRSLVWANGKATGQSASGVGAGYTAYGRSYALGAWPIAFEQAPKSVLRLARRVT